MVQSTVLKCLTVLSEICCFQLPFVLSALPHTIQLLSFAGADNLKGIAHSAWDINASLSCLQTFLLC